ncbi:MAG: hypothetical protein U9Q35_00935 [Pseudomonadota bacterium]|nr:hypothetical protein [Pseudomonadota bacterium]
MNVLQALQGHLDSGGVLTGLTPVFFRWYDEDIASTAPDSVLLRPSGGGTTNELMQQPDVTIAVATMAPHLAYDACLAIRDYLIEHYTIPGVCNFEILADVTGPLLLETERNVCELNVRCWT